MSALVKKNEEIYIFIETCRERIIIRVIEIEHFAFLLFVVNFDGGKG